MRTESTILYDKYQSWAVSCSSQHRMCYLPGSCMAGLASSIANFGQIYMKTENPGMPIIHLHCCYCQMSGIAVSFPLQLTPVNLCPQISDKVFRYLTLSETGCRTIFWASDGLRRTKRFFNLFCVIFTCPGTDMLERFIHRYVYTGRHVWCARWCGQAHSHRRPTKLECTDPSSIFHSFSLATRTHTHQARAHAHKTHTQCFVYTKPVWQINKWLNTAKYSLKENNYYCLFVWGYTSRDFITFHNILYLCVPGSKIFNKTGTIIQDRRYRWRIFLVFFCSRRNLRLRRRVQDLKLKISANRTNATHSSHPFQQNYIHIYLHTHL